VYSPTLTPAAQQPVSTPERAPAKPSDPFERAGIGVKATDAQLWASGWTKGPPERPR
jgi:hypothetical protein